MPFIIGSCEKTSRGKKSIHANLCDWCNELKSLSLVYVKCKCCVEEREITHKNNIYNLLSLIVEKGCDSPNVKPFRFCSILNPDFPFCMNFM